MDWILTTATSIIAGTTGVAIVGFLSQKWVSTRIENSIKTEYAKGLQNLASQLRRQEKLYDKLIEAAEAVSTLANDISPVKKTPMDEWDDALDMIAEVLDGTELKLRGITQKYSYILPKEIFSILQSAEFDAGDGKFFGRSDDEYYDHQRLQLAESVVNKIGDAHDKLREHVHQLAGMSLD